jgi:hypothetical protein
MDSTVKHKVRIQTITVHLREYSVDEGDPHPDVFELQLQVFQDGKHFTVTRAGVDIARMVSDTAEKLETLGFQEMQMYLSDPELQEMDMNWTFPS